MIQYCTEVTFAWSIFYLIYRLFLRKETFFRANRWYLIHTMWIGALLPYMRHLPFKWSNTDTLIYESVYYVQLGTQVVVDTVNVETAGIDFSQLLMILYLIGVVIATTRLIVGLQRIIKLYQSGKKEIYHNYILVTTDQYHLPFSFFKYVFLHHSFIEDESFNEILKHEIKHIDDKHTIDVLFIELFAILFWWNPLVYLYKNEIKQNHEFIADAYASRSSTIKNYGQILLGHSSSGIELALTNQFFNSHLKKRINMLCTTKSARYKMGKYLVLAPCLIFLGVLFSSNTLKLGENVLEQQQDFTHIKNLIGDIEGRKIVKRHYEEIMLVVNNQIGTSIAAEICINRAGKIVYAELLDKKTTTVMSADQQKQVLKAIYNYEYEANDSAPKEQCGQLTVNIESQEKIIAPEKTYVSERQYYTEGMTDPLIVINGEISETGQEHYFTKSNIISVTALDKIEGQKKWGPQYSQRVLEFITKVTKPQSKNANGEKQYVVHNGKEHDVFKVVDEMPLFPGCEDPELTIEDKQKCSTDNLLNFVFSNIKYPEEARLKSVEGMIVAQFIIYPDGQVSNFKIVRSLDEDCDLEVLKMLAKMSSEVVWTPGKQRGKPVPVLYTLPVKFKFQEEANHVDNDVELVDVVVTIARNGLYILETEDEHIVVDNSSNVDVNTIEEKIEELLKQNKKVRIILNPDPKVEMRFISTIMDMANRHKLVVVLQESNFTKENSDKVIDNYVEYKISGNEKVNADSFADDCLEPAAIIIDGKLTKNKVTWVNGKLQSKDLEDLDPSEIKGISIYKSKGERGLPQELKQFDDFCMVMDITTKNGQYGSSKSDSSIEAPQPPVAPLGNNAPSQPSPPTTSSGHSGEVLNIRMDQSNNGINKELIIKGNPIENGILSFSYKSNLKENITFTLYDISGRLVREKKYDADNVLEGEVTLDGIAPGTYYINVKQGKSMTTNQFVIQ